MRSYLEDDRKPKGSGVYMWDKMDGYDDEGKGSLNDHPEIQEKVRRVVTQGFIDPEDWKGVCILKKLSSFYVALFSFILRYM